MCSVLPILLPHCKACPLLWKVTTIFCFGLYDLYSLNRPVLLLYPKSNSTLLLPCSSFELDGNRAILADRASSRLPSLKNVKRLVVTSIQRVLLREGHLRHKKYMAKKLAKKKIFCPIQAVASLGRGNYLLHYLLYNADVVV
jgi:hypothetical protein